MSHETRPNLLLEPVDYRIDGTRRGVWRRYMYPNGEVFEEYTSYRRIFGLPLLHYTRGRCPETGKRVVAKGVVAIGRMAVGIVALGQAAAGLIAIGQLGVGLLFGLGQLSTGVAAIGQLALGLGLGLGQFVSGYVAVGQGGLGWYVLAQFGFGRHVWDMNGAAPAARQFFQWLLPG
jgi:hypothetical protein